MVLQQAGQIPTALIPTYCYEVNSWFDSALLFKVSFSAYIFFFMIITLIMKPAQQSPLCFLIS